MNLAILVSLSRDDLVALILAQHAQIEAQAQQITGLTARIAELESKLSDPPKTPNNSSLPPSKGQKPILPDRGKKKPRPSRPGVSRALAEHPDKTIEATLAACPHCDHVLGAADLTDIHADAALMAPICTMPSPAASGRWLIYVPIGMGGASRVRRMECKIRLCKMGMTCQPAVSNVTRRDVPYTNTLTVQTVIARRHPASVTPIA